MLESNSSSDGLPKRILRTTRKTGGSETYCAGFFVGARRAPISRTIEEEAKLSISWPRRPESISLESLVSSSRPGVGNSSTASIRTVSATEIDKFCGRRRNLLIEMEMRDVCLSTQARYSPRFIYPEKKKKKKKSFAVSRRGGRII